MTQLENIPEVVPGWTVSIANVAGIALALPLIMSGKTPVKYSVAVAAVQSPGAIMPTA